MTFAGRSNTMSGYATRDGKQNESDHYGLMPDVVRLLHCRSSMGETAESQSLTQNAQKSFAQPRMISYALTLQGSSPQARRNQIRS
jgi:hypothetical protein